MRSLLAVVVSCSVALPGGAADPPQQTDRYDDPLPAGALMRFGTLRTRAPITGFGIEKDGTVVTVGPGADARRWTAAEDKSSDPIHFPSVGPSTLFNHPQVSPDGKYVAACSKTKVFVWETPADAKAKPKEVAAFAIALPGVYSFSPDGTQLVVATGFELFESVQRDHRVYLCDIKTEKASELEGTSTNFGAVGFSGDGKRIVALAGGGFILWDVATAKKVAEFKIEKEWFDACALNHQGDLIVAQPRHDNTKLEWRFFDTKTGKKRDDLTGPDGGEWATFAPDDKTILVGDRSGVQWWDPVAGKLLRRFEGVASGAPVQFSPDGKTLVASSGHVLLRWEAATGKPLFPDQDTGHSESISGLGVSPDGKRIATRGWDGRLCVWDATTAAELWRAPADHWTSPRIDFSPDGKFLYVGVPKRGEVRKCDAVTGKELLKYALDPKQPKQSGVLSVRVSTDGKTVSALLGAAGPLGAGAIVAWDTNTGERLGTIRVNSHARMGGELSPAADFLSSSGDPARVEPVAEQSVNLLKGANLRSGGAPDFSDDGKWLTLIAHANTPGGEFRHWAVVLSTKTWKEVCSVPTASSGRAALSPDGRTLAVAAEDELEFFDTATAKRVGAHRLPVGAWKKSLSGYTQVLRFTPDGTKVVTGHVDTTALVWAVPSRPAK